MDLDERIEEFRNSLPGKKREAFDSLPHEYKQTLIDPEAIKKMAQASLNAAGVMKRTPATVSYTHLVHLGIFKSPVGLAEREPEGQVTFFRIHAHCHPRRRDPHRPV